MSRRHDDLSPADKLVCAAMLVTLAVCMLAGLLGLTLARFWWAMGVFLDGERMKTWDSVAILAFGLACLYFVFKMILGG